jgi:hypothetical protein
MEMTLIQGYMWVNFTGIDLHPCLFGDEHTHKNTGLFYK